MKLRSAFTGLGIVLPLLVVAWITFRTSSEWRDKPTPPLPANPPEATAGLSSEQTASALIPAPSTPSADDDPLGAMLQRATPLPSTQSLSWGEKAHPSRYSGDWHLEIKPARQVTTNFRDQNTFPHLKPNHWVLVMGCPPKLQSQQPISHSYTAIIRTGKLPGAKYFENGPARREYLKIVLPANLMGNPKQYTTETKYTVKLFSRHLVPGRPSIDIPDLTQAERTRYTAANRHIDWNEGPLADWIARKDLRRTPGESSLEFAWRVTQAVRQDFRYGSVGWNAGAVCHRGVGDCAGISSVIVGALRSAGIPARLNIGYWVSTSGKATPAYHVRLEFFVREAGGWVPVDGSGLVTWGDNGDPAFGHDDAAFLTVQLDTEILIDTKFFGIQPVTHLQLPSLWATGSGNFNAGIRKFDVTISQSLL